LVGVDLFQQVAVPVEKRTIDPGGPGDPRGTDLGALCGDAIQRGDDALRRAESA
jgi:hypothetical protein